MSASGPVVFGGGGGSPPPSLCIRGLLARDSLAGMAELSSGRVVVGTLGQGWSSGRVVVRGRGSPPHTHILHGLQGPGSVTARPGVERRASRHIPASGAAESPRFHDLCMFDCGRVSRVHHLRDRGVPVSSSGSPRRGHRVVASSPGGAATRCNTGSR